jgi:uncharacterized Zn finger protein
MTMSRETVDEKARRLLVEGRLIVREVGRPSRQQRIVAECRGDSGDMYRLGYDPEKKEWRCTCPEQRGGCSHLKALQLVCVKP